MEFCISIYFRVIAALGGPKLLERNEKKIGDGDNSGSDDDDNNDEAGTEPLPSDNHLVPSFRSDRRIVRWLIARCFADTLQQAFLKEAESK